MSSSRSANVVISAGGFCWLTTSSAPGCCGRAGGHCCGGSRTAAPVHVARRRVGSLRLLQRSAADAPGEQAAASLRARPLPLAVAFLEQLSIVAV